MELISKEFSNFKNILITGGAGFIGSHLINKLLLDSSADIYNIDKLGYASDLNRIDNHKFNNRCKLLNIDLCNFEKTKKAVNISSPCAVIHLAAESHVDNSIKSPRNFLESNIIGTFNLLEAIRPYWDNLSREKKKNFKFIHVSTDEVFGSLNEAGKFNEDSPYDPRSPYSSTKAASDHLVNAWHHTYGIPILKTNCSNNYGPWQYPEKLIPLSIFQAVNNKKIPIYGDGLNIRDWLFVEDHIDGIINVLKNGENGKTYCIGGHGETTNLEIIKKVCEIIDIHLPKSAPHERFIDFVKDRPGHDKRYAIDSSLISNKLNWSPKYTLEKGLNKTVKWYLQNIKWCQKVLKNK